MNELQEVLINILLGLITIVGLYILAFIRSYIARIKEKIQYAKDEKARQLAIEAMDRIEKLAETTVLALESESAKELREKVKQGDEPRWRLTEVGKWALYDVKNMIGDEYMDALNDQMVDVDKYIRSVIEAKLEQYKASGKCGAIQSR